MKQKKGYLELVRIIAIFFVIYVHTGTDAAEHYRIAETSASYGLSLVLYAFAQVSVPLFFLVTGAVLLQKEESLKDVLLHRALRIFALILLFGLLQYAYCYYLQPEVSFSLPVFFWLVYSTTVITQYWYLYAYFTLMLILPFVRMLARSLQKAHFWYLFGLYFLLNGLLPIVEYLWGNNRTVLSVPLLADLIFYPLIGYYVEHLSEDFFYRKRVLIVANLGGAMALFTNVIIALMAHRQRGAAESLTGMTALLALVIFIDVRALYRAAASFAANRLKQTGFSYSLFQTCKKGIYFAGSAVFGIYLLEPQLRDSFRFIYTTLTPHISWFPACVLWILAAMLCGILIFKILKKIPLLKKLL